MRTLVKVVLVPLVMFGLVGFSGCESIGPRNPEEAIAASYFAIEALADTTHTAREAGVLDREEVSRAKEQLQRAKDATDSARRALAQGRDSEAETLLARASTALEIVRTILEDYRGRDSGSDGHARSVGSAGARGAGWRQRLSAGGSGPGGAGRGPAADGRGAEGDGRLGAGRDRPTLIAA